MNGFDSRPALRPSAFAEISARGLHAPGRPGESRPHKGARTKTAECSHSRPSLESRERFSRRLCRLPAETHVFRRASPRAAARKRGARRPLPPPQMRPHSRLVQALSARPSSLIFRPRPPKSPRAGSRERQLPGTPRKSSSDRRHVLAAAGALGAERRRTTVCTEGSAAEAIGNLAPGGGIRRVRSPSIRS